jgi:hypothetical protein
MRPKKVILLVGTDEVALSVLAYILRIHAYKDVPVLTPADALLYASTSPFDMLLITETVELAEANALIDNIRAVQSRPCLLLHKPWPVDKWPVHRADMMLMADTPAIDLLERIRISSQRKRGPRKGFIPSKQAIECLA